jgi:hypothetical protein
MPITLVLRSVKGSGLTNTEIDANFSNIKAFTEALVTQINNKLNGDGTLKPGAISDATQIVDATITPSKLKSAGSGDAGKTYRVNASGVLELVDSPKAFTVADTDAISSTGVQTAKILSTLVINNIPAGDIHVVATVGMQKNAGANGGTVMIKEGSTVVADAPTHLVDLGSQWLVQTLHGVISAFAGGTLTLTIVFETSESTSDITFGVGGDSRFGRKVTLLAGL